MCKYYGDTHIVLRGTDRITFNEECECVSQIEADPISCAKETHHQIEASDPFRAPCGVRGRVGALGKPNTPACRGSGGYPRAGGCPEGEGLGSPLGESPPPGPLPSGRLGGASHAPRPPLGSDQTGGVRAGMHWEGGGRNKKGGYIDLYMEIRHQITTASFERAYCI